MPPTKIELGILELIQNLEHYREEVRWAELDPDTVQRIDAGDRVARAHEKMRELEGQITYLITSIFGDVTGIEERKRLAKELEREKIDEEIKRLINKAVDEQIITKNKELIEEEITGLRRVIRGLPQRTTRVKELESNLRSLRREVKNFSQRRVNINLNESETMKELFKLRKQLANLGKEEAEDIYAVYPATGERKEVSVGTLSVDFLTGDVTLPSGTVEHTNYRLQNTVFDVMRSLSVDTTKAIAAELDDGTKFTIEANQFYSISNRKFRITYLHCSETTELRVYASTSKDSAIRFEANVQNTDEQRYTRRVEYSGSNPVYIGEALPGSAEDSAVWRIQQIEYSSDNPVAIKWAGGTEKFTNKWSERTSYQYA